MRIIYAAVLAMALDMLLGDPAWLVHPVVIMGRYISRAEEVLRKRFPATERGELAAGLVLAVSLPFFSLAITLTTVVLMERYFPAAGFVLQVFWGWQALALRGLITAGKEVADCLDRGGLEEARKAVGKIVGRDTGSLSAEGVIKACVESLAENFSDGVAAPLFYFMIGGAPLALCYKAINTLDSMTGYKNDKYLYFGRASARLDDAANLIPSRLAALFLIAAAGLTEYNAGDAFRVWKRDRRKHDSPNSAQTEAAVAGALGIELGGGSYYFGKYKEKPVIGDKMREAETGDIRRTGRLVFLASLISLAVFCAIRAGVYIYTGM